MLVFYFILLKIKFQLDKEDKLWLLFLSHPKKLSNNKNTPSTNEPTLIVKSENQVPEGCSLFKQLFKTL